jgi:hypothetical protein
MRIIFIRQTLWQPQKIPVQHYLQATIREAKI